MRTIGRNDLCPCGSGKKYKHCCQKRQTQVIESAYNQYPDQDKDRVFSYANWELYTASILPLFSNADKEAMQKCDGNPATPTHSNDAGNMIHALTSYFYQSPWSQFGGCYQVTTRSAIGQDTDIVALLDQNPMAFYNIFSAMNRMEMLTVPYHSFIAPAVLCNLATKKCALTVVIYANATHDNVLYDLVSSLQSISDEYTLVDIMSFLKRKYRKYAYNGELITDNNWDVFLLSFEEMLGLIDYLTVGLIHQFYQPNLSVMQAYYDSSPASMTGPDNPDCKEPYLDECIKLIGTYYDLLNKADVRYEDETDELNQSASAIIEEQLSSISSLVYENDKLQKEINELRAQAKSMAESNDIHFTPPTLTIEEGIQQMHDSYPSFPKEAIEQLAIADILWKEWRSYIPEYSSIAMSYCKAVELILFANCNNKLDTPW